MTDRILSRSSFSHIVDVSIERIDIADWLCSQQRAQAPHRGRRRQVKRDNAHGLPAWDLPLNG